MLFQVYYTTSWAIMLSVTMSLTISLKKHMALVKMAFQAKKNIANVIPQIRH